MPADKKEPTVKLVADFSLNERVIHSATREEHTIVFIDEKSGICRLSGSAANSPLSAIEKILS